MKLVKFPQEDFMTLC